MYFPTTVNKYIMDYLSLILKKFEIMMSTVVPSTPKTKTSPNTCDTDT